MCDPVHEVQFLDMCLLRSLSIIFSREEGLNPQNPHCNIYHCTLGFLHRPHPYVQSFLYVFLSDLDDFVLNRDLIPW